MSQLSQPLHLLSLGVFLSGIGACSSNNGDPGGQTSYGGSGAGSHAGAAGHAPNVGGSTANTPGGTSFGGTTFGGSAATTVAGSAPIEEIPLLRRPTQKAFDCRIKSPTSIFSDPGAARATLVPGASGNHVAYALDGFEFKDDQFIQYQGLRWASIALDGTLSAPTVVSETVPYSLVAGAQGNRVSIVWSQYDDAGSSERLWSAQVDADGNLVTAPKAIWNCSGDPGALRLLNANGQLSLFWSEYSQTGLIDGGEAGSGYRAFYGQLDASGGFSETPKPILVDEIQPVIVAAAPHGDDYSVAYIAQRGDASELHYVTLDRSGAARNPAVLVDPSSSGIWGWGSSVGMTVVNDRVLLASVAQSGSGESGIARVIQIFRLDTAGNRLGATLALQAPVIDEENVSPTWVKLDEGHVGLLWSKGSVIYMCAGCQPDNHLQFVVLDSDTLQPNSDVIDLGPNSTSGGLTSADVAWAAPNLFITTSIEHHTTAEAASAAIECVPH